MRIVLIAIVLIQIFAASIPDTPGFQIGEVKGYKLIKKARNSSLYQIDCPQIKDGKPIKLIQLVGTNFEVGYDYATLLGPQIIDTYKMFMSSAIANRFQLLALEIFLDWQYDNFVSLEIPFEFKEQLKGLQSGGMQEHKIKNLRNLIQRVLVISSYPGDISDDIVYAMMDIFLQDYLRIKNPKLLNYVQNNLIAVVKFIRRFINRKRIHCSFFAVWGSRTEGGKLYTMRNLDWEPNTGINKNKLIMIWKIKDTIPHATIGYPGIIGALTGMSKAGLTVHEAGLDSFKETEHGFQWTLRLRYIMMHANNLAQAKEIWKSTSNTFGMNHMIASAADVATGECPVFVVETMRDYTAWFSDKDSREDGVNFTDPKTKKSFRAGYAIKDAVFRTNHAYDPTINKYTTSLPSQESDTMYRYFIIKDSFSVYANKKIGELQALNITSSAADKGGNNFYKCPVGVKDKGINIISVMFIPGEMRMYAAIQYGQGNNYRTACCGVYLNINLTQWF